MINIQNDSLLVRINLLGAEVRSIQNTTTGHEYMWSGHESVWSGVSPVLFPVVGKSTNNKIKYKNKYYSMGNHGLARNTVFNVVRHDKESVMLAMETTKSDYPFMLRFEVVYSLDGNKLITKYNITNLDTEIASCGFGAHPAFACPFDEKHSFSDYEISFLEQNLEHHSITPDAFYTNKISSHKLSKLKLDIHTFDKDALVYSGFSDKKVRLVEKGSSRYIEIEFDGFEYLGIWSKPYVSANYVCIEPWCGKSDVLGFDGDIDKREGNIKIGVNEALSQSYSIKFAY